MQSDPRVWIAALRSSHEQLTGLVRPLSPEQVRGASYCSDWTIAQVLSHLGSGAEIAMLMLPGALGEGDPVSREAFGPVWDVWNAKTPDAQAADALAADDAHITRLEQLSDAQLGAISMSFFGMELDAVGLVRMRLGEHSMHTWDVAVALDPAATVPPGAVDLLTDNVVEFLAPRLGKAPAEPFAVRITTTGPERDYLLATADAVQVTPWPQGGTGALARQTRMPAEALLRLVYGRLDPEHTPAGVSGDAADLARLREIYPGF